MLCLPILRGFTSPLCSRMDATAFRACRPAEHGGVWQEVHRVYHQHSVLHISLAFTSLTCISGLFCFEAEIQCAAIKGMHLEESLHHPGSCATQPMLIVSSEVNNLALTTQSMASAVVHRAIDINIVDFPGTARWPARQHGHNIFREAYLLFLVQQGGVVEAAPWIRF